MRTAAVSAIAAKLLAPKEAKILAILGSGVQARSHFQALPAFKEVRVWSPTATNAQKFAAEVGATAGGGGSAGGSATSASATAGATVFAANCSGCHGAAGQGQPGVFPPLAGNPVVVGDAGKVIHILNNGLNGAIQVNGATYNGQMPAWKGNLTPKQIADVITYIRSAWGNKGGPVTEAQVAAAK